LEDVEDNQEATGQMLLGIFAIKREGSESTDDLEDVGNNHRWCGSAL